MKRNRNIFQSGLLAAVIFAALTVVPQNAVAQITENEVRAMDQFLDAHPETREDLTRSPQLGNDRNYLNSHPELNDFLNRDQDVRNEMRNNANNFMRAATEYQTHGLQWAPYPAGEYSGGPGGEYQPHMRAALEHLQQALNELETAASDKGGYRKKAMEEVRRAQADVQAGIAYDNHH
jgi:aromatic ring hydroxylase